MTQAPSPIRVTVTFTGRLSGSLGICYECQQRRTLRRLPSPFTYDQAKEAARLALYYPEGDSPAYRSIHGPGLRVAFN